MEDRDRIAKLWNEYIRIVSPQYKNLEKERREDIIGIIKYFFLFFLMYGTLACLVVLYFAYRFNAEMKGELHSAPLYAIALIIATIVAINKSLGMWNKEFKSTLKRMVIDKLLKLFGDIHRHGCLDFNTPIINDTNLKKSKLFLEYARKSADDVIYGRYSNVNFEAAEFDMEAEVENGKGIREYKRIFKGIVLAFQNNKNVTCNTILATKDVLLRNHPFIHHILINLPTLSAVFGILFLLQIFSDKHYDISVHLPIFIALCVIVLIALLITYFLSGAFVHGQDKTFNKVTLEYNRFNRRFNVYSSDQIESRYILTPALMDRIYNLKKVFSSNNIRCSFFEDKIIIAVETKRDLFELGCLFKPIKDIKNIKQFYLQLTSIFDIIDSLKIETNK